MHILTAYSQKPEIMDTSLIYLSNIFHSVYLNLKIKSITLPNLGEFIKTLKRLESSNCLLGHVE